MGMFHHKISRGHGTYEDNLLQLKNEMENADAIVIGAGA